MLVRYVDEDIVDTIKKMETKKQEYVPILKNDKIIGIFSDKTIRQLLIKNNKEKTFEKILTLLKTPSDVKFAKPEDTSCKKHWNYFKMDAKWLFVQTMEKVQELFVES